MSLILKSNNVIVTTKKSLLLSVHYVNHSIRNGQAYPMAEQRTCWKRGEIESDKKIMNTDPPRLQIVLTVPQPRHNNELLEEAACWLLS